MQVRVRSKRCRVLSLALVAALLFSMSIVPASAAPGDFVVSSLTPALGPRAGGQLVTITTDQPFLPAAGDYIQDDLIVHLDALNNTGSGYAEAPATWKNLAEDTAKGRPDFSLRGAPVFGDRKLILNGTSQGAFATVNLKDNGSGTNYTSLTVESAISNLSSTQMSDFLFESSQNWNSNAGGVGAVLHSNGGANVLGTVHTVFNATGAGAGARNYLFTNWEDLNTHTNIFSRLADPVGRLTYQNGGEPLTFTSTYPNPVTPTNPGGHTTPATTTTFRNDVLNVGFRSNNGSATSFMKANITSFRVYARSLEASEVVHNAEIDELRFGTPISITFDGLPATDVRVIDEQTITCLTPAHASGMVKVAVTIGDDTQTLKGAYTYISEKAQTYGAKSCGTCHEANLHGEHATVGCDACHLDTFSSAPGSLTNWGSASIPGLSAASADYFACGTKETACHAVGAATGRIWHGYRIADMNTAHSLEGTTTTCGVAGCHATYSTTTPFYFGNMNLAQAHNDYAYNARRGKISLDADPALVAALGPESEGCSVCHERNYSDPARLKPYVREAMDSMLPLRLSCVDCHNAVGSTYLPDQDDCLTTLQAMSHSGSSGASKVSALLKKTSPSIQPLFTDITGTKQEPLLPGLLKTP